MTLLGRKLKSGPLVSVIVATRNREAYLPDLLESLAKQSFRSFEVIIVDDSDRKESRKAVSLTVRRFLGSLKIKLLRNPRRLGIPRSLNRGLLAARGRIVAFTDDDCIVDRTWLENIVRWYRYPNIGGVGGRVIPVDNDARWVPEHRPYPGVVGKVLRSGEVVSNFDLDVGPVLVDCLPGANMSFRRDLLLKAGGFSQAYEGNAYRFETDLSLRIKRLGYRIVFDPRAIVYHRRAPRGGARVNAYKWNYWFARNHTVFLLTCLSGGTVKTAYFAVKETVRILKRRRACPYAYPDTWHKVLCAVLRGILDGIVVGLRYAVLRNHDYIGYLRKSTYTTYYKARLLSEPLLTHASTCIALERHNPRGNVG